MRSSLAIIDVEITIPIAIYINNKVFSLICYCTICVHNALDQFSRIDINKGYNFRAVLCCSRETLACSSNNRVNIVFCSQLCTEGISTRRCEVVIIDGIVKADYRTNLKRVVSIVERQSLSSNLNFGVIHNKVLYCYLNCVLNRVNMTVCVNKSRCAALVCLHIRIFDSEDCLVRFNRRLTAVVTERQAVREFGLNYYIVFVLKLSCGTIPNMICPQRVRYILAKC